MHLKQLKLAGFKSFVDPVIVPFSSQMVAVVGPNGCGKSNIIDAVRWVMGESSAKSLRGDSMVDVIFNGSSNRKALGQASVELIFDNRLGRLGGVYASYQEIAVKRLVTRDGESSYYLNGTRCRRRDITDIFLGTGAGARGYSIISQGTISRLIEARPEELRAYLEEAAGVSKYKERRRETIQRIAATRDNLARVKDISDELSKQLVRLERQASSAKQYTLLKQEEHQCRADIFALKWQALSNEQTLAHQELSQLSVALESHQAQSTAAKKNAIDLREMMLEVNDFLDEKTAAFYQLSTEIARLEEVNLQRMRDKERLFLEKQGLQANAEKISQQLAEDKDVLKKDQESLEKLQHTLAELQLHAAQAQQIFDAQSQEEAAWNEAWKEVQVNFSKISRDVEVKGLRLQDILDKRRIMQVRLGKIQEEDAHDHIDALKIELAQLQQLQSTLGIQLKLDQDNAQASLSKAHELRQALLEKERELHKTEDILNATTTQHAALKVQQHAALYRQMGDTDAQVPYQNKPRVLELIHVEEEWQPIVEWVLGDKLYAVVLSSMDELWVDLPTIKTRFALFVKPSLDAQPAHLHPRLIDKIQGDTPHGFPELSDVFAANNLTEAMSWLPSLSKTQSIVTLDGYWISLQWVRVSNKKSPNEESLLAQKDALDKLTQRLEQQKIELSELQSARIACHEKLMLHVEHQEACKQKALESQDAKRECDLNSQQKAMLLEKMQQDQAALYDERDGLIIDLEDITAQILETEEQNQALIQSKHALELKQNQLLLDKESRHDAFIQAQQQTNETRQNLHESDVIKARLSVKIEQLESSIAREVINLERVHARLETVVQALYELDKPQEDVRILLDEKIKAHHTLDLCRVDAQKKLDELEQDRLKCENIIHQQTTEIGLLQEKRQSVELNAQALNIRMADIVEALNDLSLSPQDVLHALGSETTLARQEETLLRILDKIKRLGAINLVAIEEYESELLRKTHLDSQSQDLLDALAILESAILKMDRDTEIRFKETFDEVNALFQALFPRLFGGGRAMLELTCGNLLEAGILVTAQPPGKRNSTIQLLSGGEKAMTAVALVFAIFKLNPSPFCMLDEVDAPLDDANVRRFCELMQEMSQCVQFLFITHNKVTMEIADHLIGVTMREPGVSRVVAVDVEEALNFAQ